MDLIYPYKNEDSSKESRLAAQARQVTEAAYRPYLTRDIGLARYVVVHGGDGTGIDAIREVALYQKTHPNVHPTVIGFNYGNVGALMNQPIAGAPYNDISQLVQEAQEIVFYPLMVRATDDSGKVYEDVAINDVVCRRASTCGQSCHLSVQINAEEPVQTGGDGLIISTATGSTAYYRNAGGKPFDVATHQIGVWPICDLNGAQKIGGTYADNTHISIRVLNHNGKRPVSLNADNNEQINRIRECHVWIDKTNPIKLLAGPRCSLYRADRVRA